MAAIEKDFRQSQRFPPSENKSHQNENPSEESCEMSNLLRTARCSNSALYIRKSEIENSVGTEILNVY